MRAFLILCALAIPAGAATGLVGGAFRWTLERAEAITADVSSWAHGIGLLGWLVPVALTALCAAAAAWIVERVRLASGSGIQHVEAVYRGEAEAPPLAVVPARFVGGVLAIGSGLVLGREGPTVHMGAAIGAGAGRLARLDGHGIRELQTALAGAGLAVAFNAPFGGFAFVVEEVLRALRWRIIVPAAIGVAVATVCARLIHGSQPDFAVAEVAWPSLPTMLVVIVFAVLVGLLGAGYARVVLIGLDAVERLTRIHPIVRAAGIGAVIGLLLFLDPALATGGDALTQAILAGHGIAVPLLVLTLAVRFLAGPLSYAAGTPGGLFAPMLALGAVAGALAASAAEHVVPGLGPDFGVTMALVGMSALFAAAVRAPLTGVLLVLELTAVAGAVLPMVLASAVALVVAELVRVPPIYETLRERLVGR